MYEKKSNKALGSLALFRKMLFAISAIFFTTLVSGCFGVYDMIYLSIFRPISRHERIPIDLTKANSVATTPIRINRTGNGKLFEIYLEFELEGAPDRMSPNFPVEKRKRLFEFVGCPSLDKGVKIPVRLTISNMEKEDQVTYRDEEYLTKGCSSSRSNGFSRYITAIRLKPGNYLVRLENLKEVANMPDGVTVALSVVRFFRK